MKKKPGGINESFKKKGGGLGKGKKKPGGLRDPNEKHYFRADLETTGSKGGGAIKKVSNQELGDTPQEPRLGTFGRTKKNLQRGEGVGGGVWGGGGWPWEERAGFVKIATQTPPQKKDRAPKKKKKGHKR